MTMPDDAKIDTRSGEPEPAAEHGQILRRMTDQDRAQQSQCTARADADYQAWLDRIRDWKLNLELIDLEWPLEGEQPILYVLTSRGPDATKLTLQAAAAGLPAIHVQPVGPQGAILPEPEKSSGCGSCGCH